MGTKRITNYVLLAIAIITPLIINPSSLDSSQFPKLLFVYIVTSALAILLFLYRKSNSIIFSSIEKLIVTYLILVIISTMFSNNILLSTVGRPLRWEGLVAIITYIFLFIISSRNYEYSKIHVKLFLIIAFVVALYGIIQYFGYEPFPRVSPIKFVSRASSTMGNPNFLGTYLALVLPICSFAYIYTKKSLYLVVSGVVYLSLLCTMTRGTWLGALAGIALLIVYIIQFKYSFKHLVYLLLSFLIITIFLEVYSDGRIIGRMLSIGNDFGAVLSKAEDYENAGANRIYIWERVILFIKQKPFFGYGLENLGEVFTEKYSDEIIKLYNREIIFDKAHNEYLHIAVSTGIPSLILYLSFIAVIISKAWKNAKNNPLIIPLLCSIIGYLVQAFFNISVVSVAYIYWIFLGVMLKLSLDAEAVTNEDKRGDPSTTVGMTVLQNK